MSAWSIPSGEYPILAAKHNGPRQRRDTLRHPPEHRALVIVGATAASVAGLALVVYPLAAFGYEIHRVARNLLIGAIIVGAVVAALALISGLGIRIIRHHAERQAAALVWEIRGLHAAVAPTSGQLAELGEDLRVQVDRQGKTYTAMVEQLGQRLGELEQAIRQRVEAVERRVEEQDEEYERGWVDGAAKTAEVLPGNGQVRQLHPPRDRPPIPRRPR